MTAPEVSPDPLIAGIQLAAALAMRSEPTDSDWRCRMFVAYLCEALSVSHPELSQQIQQVGGFKLLSGTAGGATC